MQSSLTVEKQEKHAAEMTIYISCVLIMYVTSTYLNVIGIGLAEGTAEQ